MKNLWTPWRMEYILGEKPGGCVLCIDPPGSSASAMAAEDERRLVAWRGKLVFVILNRYPYAAGHLMVVPYRHVSDLTDLTPEESADMMTAAQLCCRVLRKVSKAEGINIGVNLGKAAGAGIRDHLHLHVVPRWVGDSQFIAVMDEVRIIPEYLVETWRRLKPVFNEMAANPAPNRPEDRPDEEPRSPGGSAT